MQKYWFIPIFSLAAVLIGLWVAFAGPQVGEKEDFSDQIGGEELVHYHAGFQVYVNDELQDFSNFKFMTVEPCNVDEENEGADASLGQSEETVDLHNGVGEVIHVHAPNMTWRNVAEYINVMGGFGFTEESAKNVPIVGYVNGEKADDIASYPIEAHDSVVIFVGENTNIEEKLLGRVTDERITAVDNSNDGCGL